MSETVIDLKQVKQVVRNELPPKARWVIAEMYADYDFGDEASSLQPVSEKDFFLAGARMPEEWSKLRKFGELDFCEGGGAMPLLTIHEEDGRVYGLQVDREGDEVYLYNSSITHFANIFKLLHPYFSTERKIPSDLAEQVRQADPQSFDQSEWKSLLEYVTDQNK